VATGKKGEVVTLYQYDEEWVMVGNSSDVAIIPKRFVKVTTGYPMPPPYTEWRTITRINLSIHLSLTIRCLWKAILRNIRRKPSTSLKSQPYLDPTLQHWVHMETRAIPRHGLSK